MLRAAEATYRTDPGRQRRDNEDSAFVRAPLFVVADGMGGAQAGEVASRIAIEAFERGLPETGTAEARLADRVREANRQIYERSLEERDRAGMGTTLTAAYLDDSRITIAHVGDSRAYLFRHGSLARLTQDHSLVEELVKQGKLTEEEAAEHPQRSIITRALGPEPEVEVDTLTVEVGPNDLLLLCSDGLTTMVPEERVAEILASGASLDRIAQDLIDEANRAGGRDNITVILLRLEDAGAAASDAPSAGLGAAEQDTFVNAAPTATGEARASSSQSEPVSAPAAVAVAQRPPRLRRGSADGEATAARKRRRFAKPLAALIALVVVLFLVGGGGYLATRQLYFVGTNSQGIVTIYRGLPYDLPGGIHLYETFFTSGYPASLVPADRRGTLFNNQLRSQSDAQNLVRTIELGQLHG
ncbi:MAG: Stp1/IreP family PP2C-type Ser/Thr phosphatase [Actinomycetota bacterium]|nr:Stp1/IreP family PP2C-type Ser/Thr phosphatase [Actinomycetota bacterium]